jgi:3'-phosphoadenosine 5'-phosphosulfate sulfotransferase (PAPS reductase)/FAD synthetase
MEQGGQVFKDKELEQVESNEQFAGRFNRKLFKAGGKVMSPSELAKHKKKLEKELSDQVEKETKRLKKYTKLRNKKSNIGSHTVNMATMVTSIDDKITLFKQRELMIEWAKNPDNNVKFIVAFSGGKDSVAMVLHLLFELNLPRDRVELWHHEVDGKEEDLWDWKCTTSYCTAFAKAMGVKILYSYRDGGITREIFRGKEKPETPQGVYFQEEQGGKYSFSKPRGSKDDYKTKLKFPAVSQSLDTRWCSASAKIDVMKRAIANTPSLMNVNAIICTGERRLESKNRSKYLEIEPYNFAHDRDILTWRPVIDWTEKKIWELYEFYGIQPHPSYELGWGRCSCQLCIFSSADHWATNNVISPEKVKRIAEIEKEIDNTLYYKKVKNRNTKQDIYEAKVNKGTSVLNKESSERWVKEATGEFVSPIFVDEWKLPLGAYNGDDCGAN